MRSPSRRRRPSGRVSVLPYTDYFDEYYDEYSDYGDYPDTYPDYSDFSPYEDYGDYNDSGTPGRRPDHRLGQLIQKIVVVEGHLSYPLAGDPDVDSSLFEGLTDDDQGRRIGVLPRLLNEGWTIKRMAQPDTSGRIIVLVQRWIEESRRTETKQ